jgi:hypothetical protein
MIYVIAPFLLWLALNKRIGVYWDLVAGSSPKASLAEKGASTSATQGELKGAQP